jgi:hypothetical protein
MTGEVMPRQRRQTVSTMPPMRGDLSETSVADLSRRWADGTATGALELEGPDGTGRIFFRRGAVTWAVSPAPRARLGDRLVNGGLLTDEQLAQALATQREADEPPKLGAILVDDGLVTRDVIRVFVQEQILDAVFDLMHWRDGAYVFHPDEVADEELPVDLTVDQLLVEVSRRQSEWQQIQSVIPHLGMVPDVVAGASSATASLEPDEFAVLATVDGRRDVRELADDLGYSRFEAARIIYGLALLGIVDLTPPEDVAAPRDDVAPAEDAVDRPADLSHTNPTAEPEPWVAGDEPAAASASTASTAVPGEALDDDDFDALLGELAAGPAPGGDEPAHDPADEEPTGDQPEPGPTSDDDRPAERTAPPSGPAGSREGGRGTGGADVSEFLRELSQLALDDADEGSGGGRPRPREPERSADDRDTTPDDAPARDTDRRPPDEQRDDGSGGKKRGLFGWGR